MGYFTFYRPIYRLDGLIKLITALVSWMTVLALIRVIPRALSMRSPEELEQEIAARLRAEEALQRAHDALENRVQERTARIQALNEDLGRAMAETHHRLKNNLQIVSALLEMQIDDTTDAMPREVVQESLRQIKTIALVHDLLARDQTWGEVDIVQALKNLAPLLSAGWAGGKQSASVRLEGDEGPIYLPTKAATGLALIVNELATNAVKHSYATLTERGSDLIIIVRLTRQPQERLSLCVEDNGPGFPTGFDATVGDSLGLTLIDTIVTNDLQGEVAYGNRLNEAAEIAGACVCVTFPERPHAE